MSPRRRAVPAAALVLSLSAMCAAADDQPGAPPGPPAPPPWMVAFEATDKQPIGMNESDLQAFLEKQVKSKWHEDKRTWKDVWEKVFLTMTPAHAREVPAFWLSKYEVTNAQWEVFLRDRMETYTTEGGETLEAMAIGLWHIEDPGKQGAFVQHCWKSLLAKNEKALLPVLNPDSDPRWDPAVARSQEFKLPKGIELSYPRYAYPYHWLGVAPAEHERRRPMRFLSWEQCVDFCQWAGFHLPTEFEWERGARGSEGRWFPWGNEYDPTRAVGAGFNRAAKGAAAKARAEGGEPAVLPVVLGAGSPDDAPNDTPGPAAVDSLPLGATPEGIHHMMGNVSEFTFGRLEGYPRTKSPSRYFGESLVSRGSNWTDRAELFLAADRNWETPRGGALVASHTVDGTGFRLAAYPVPGADLTVAVAQIWTDRSELNGPRIWQPVAPGVASRKESEPYAGFAVQRTAGLLERSIANDAQDFAYVTARARGVAVLPVKGFPYEFVKTESDLRKLLADPDRPVLLGILAGTEGMSAKVQVTERVKVKVQPKEKGKPEEEREEDKLTDVVVPLRGDNAHFAASYRLYTKAYIGLMLVLEGDRVVVYAPDATVGGVAKYRTAPLGRLAEPAKIVFDRGPQKPSEAVLEKGVAVLTVPVALLDGKGEVQKGAPTVRVTVRIPLAE